MPKKKIYILDTNVLVLDPQSMFAFADRVVGIPIFVLEELDQFKGEATERGAATRQVIRQLDALRKSGSLKDGVPLSNGGRLEVLFTPEDVSRKQLPFKIDIADNEILLTAVGYKNKGYDVCFVSKDLNARVKADVLGIHAEDYLKDQISKEKFYRGWEAIQVPSVQLKQDRPSILDTVPKEYELYTNEFVMLESRNNPQNYKVFRYLGGKEFKRIYAPRFQWDLHPRNAQQLMALDLLMDPTIQLVSLIGPAGTGKTFLALLAGLHKVLIEHEYKKMLISRPVVPLGKDIGYLPGTMEEKLQSWMKPIYDNMEFISHSSQAQVAPEDGIYKTEVYKDKHKKKKKPGRHRKEHSVLSVDDLVRQGKIDVEALTYMRGRSIPFQFIMIDEVQNLSLHEVKTLISRVGEGSKIILTGDPYQIDAPYLDFRSNGLMVATNKFKGQKLFGSVYLHSSERSELSQLVNELL